MNGESLSLEIRAATPNDRNFILSTWLQSYRKGSDQFRKVYRPLFFKFYQEIVKRTLIRSVACVAGPPGDELTIFGYCVVEDWTPLTWERLEMEARPIIHFIYTKEAFQHMGVATKLLGAMIQNPTRVYFSHYTRDRIDTNQSSKSYGTLRHRGAETLLSKWPLAREERNEEDQHKPHFRDGNLYIPWLCN